MKRGRVSLASGSVYRPATKRAIWAPFIQHIMAKPYNRNGHAAISISSDGSGSISIFRPRGPEARPIEVARISLDPSDTQALKEALTQPPIKEETT